MQLILTHVIAHILDEVLLNAINKLIDPFKVMDRLLIQKGWDSK